MDRRRKVASIVITSVALQVAQSLIANSYQPPPGIRNRDEDQYRLGAWLSSCLNDDEQLFAESRLRRPVFDELVRLIRQGGVRDGHVTVAGKLLCFLYMCSNGASYRNTKYKTGLSLSTISKLFHEILDAILKLYTQLVSLPSTRIPDAIRDDPKRWPAFKDCVGAIDGTHIKIHVPANQQRPYRNRHGYLSQNVLAAVDFDMNFTFVLAGWEGSAHDGRVYKDAIHRGFKSPGEKRYYLADAGYANKDLLLSPYRGVRYHLREISQVGRSPSDKYELFNYRHSSLRNVVERTFGVFKRRWRVFDRQHEFSIKTQVKLVYALAAVHNLINKFYSVEEDFDRWGPISVDEETSVDREGSCDTNEPGSTAMNQLREEIATQLWEDYCEARRRVAF